MSQAQINAIQQTVAEIIELVQTEGISSFSEETKNALAELLEQSTERLIELRANLQQPGAAPPTQPPITPPIGPRLEDGVNLLWILSGGQEDAFVNYLRTFPGAEFQNLLRNPTELTRTIERLRQQNPLEGQPRGEADGIPQANLESSNIYGFNYNPSTRQLQVRFQGGSVYKYDGVPPGIFNVFQNGAVPAKTSGQNQYGRWWQGKIPSLGAAFYEMIRNGGYPYERLN